MLGETTLKMSRLITLIAILIGFSGCTQHLVIHQYPMKPGMVPEFSGSQPVELVNAQDNTGNVMIGSASGVKYTTSTHQMTNAAMRMLGTELEKGNISTSEDADKQLRLAIHDVSIVYSKPHFRCVLHLKAETGNGYIGDFEGNHVARQPERACGGAILRAVAAMLNDDAILAYLKH
jgi:hypothetical protein